MIAEYDASNQLLRRYVHGPNDDEPLVWYEGSGTSDRRWLLADERGSIIAVTDGTGTATVINSYDEYGVPGTANTGRFQYTGQAWLPEYGFYHYKARAYSPTLGRFLQTDPTGYDDGMNIYAYVGNDPLNKTDPDGKLADIIFDVGFLMVDVVDIANNGFTKENIASLAGNVVGAVVPGLTGVGVAARGGTKAADTAQAASKGGDSARYASKSQKAEIFERSGGKCEYCGKDITRAPGKENSQHADHSTAYSRGGKTTSSNLNSSCPSCNLSKGSKELSTTPGTGKYTPPNPSERVQDQLKRFRDGF